MMTLKPQSFNPCFYIISQSVAPFLQFWNFSVLFVGLIINVFAQLLIKLNAPVLNLVSNLLFISHQNEKPTILQPFINQEGIVKKGISISSFSKPNNALMSADCCCSWLPLSLLLSNVRFVTFQRKKIFQSNLFVLRHA